MLRYISILMLLWLLSIPLAGRAELTRGTYGVTTPVTGPFDVMMAVTGKSETPYRPTGDGVSNGRDIYYFPALTPQGTRIVLTTKAGSEEQAAPPEVVGAMPLPAGPAGGEMVRSGSTLFLATETELIRMEAEDIPTTATIQVVPGIGPVTGLDVQPGTGRLLRLGSRLECYDPSPSGYVLRGSGAISGDSLLVDAATDTIVVLDRGVLRSMRWQAGSATPELGQSLLLSSYVSGKGSVVQGPSGNLFVGLDRYVSTIKLRPYPSSPMSVAGEGYGYFEIGDRLYLGPTGLFTGSRAYLPFSADGNLPVWGTDFTAHLGVLWPYANRTRYEPRLAFGATRGPMVAVASLNGEAVHTICQIAVSPTHPENFLHGMIFRMEAGRILTSVGFDSRKAGGKVRVSLYTARESQGPYTLLWEGESTTETIAGRNTMPVPIRPVMAIPTDMALVIRSDDPDVLAFGSRFGWSDPIFSVFSLRATGSSWPAEFWRSELLPRDGSVGLVANWEAVAHLDGIVMRSDTPHGVYSFPGYTSGSPLAYAEGEFDTLEISETQDFTGAVARAPFHPYVGIPYHLSSQAPGERTLYFRGTAGSQITATVSAKFVVDPFPPSTPGTPVCSGGQLVVTTRPEFNWAPSSDEGASGLRYYTYEVDGNDPYPGTTSPDVTYVIPATKPPELIRVRVRAMDNVGNLSPWSEYSAYIQVLRNEVPNLAQVETLYQFQPTRATLFKYWRGSANPEYVEMSEDPTFSSVQSESWYQPGIGHAAVFYLGNDEGVHTTYHRLRSTLGTSKTIRKDVFLDTRAPVPESPVPVSNFGANGSMDVAWRMPVDPEPGSGTKSARLRIVGLGPLNGHEVELWSDSPTTYTVQLPIGKAGGEYRAVLSGLDAAGHRSAEAESHPFVINARPLPPTLALSTEAPISTDWIVVSASRAEDPDGDKIVGYANRFVRLSPGPSLVVESSVLPPGQTARGERWYATAAGLDSRGAVGFPATSASFTIGNSKPTRPFVRILPPVAEPGKSIVVDVLQYSTDPDGDPIGYDFRWSKSVDNGATWIAKLELDGNSQVDGRYIEQGHLWKVEYVPYEKTTGKVAKAERVEGQAAWDIVRVGADNLPPVLTVGQPRANPPAPDGSRHIRATWSATDPDGDPVTVAVYLTNLGTMDLTPVAQSVVASSVEFDCILPPDGPYYLHLVARRCRDAEDDVAYPDGGGRRRKRLDARVASLPRGPTADRQKERGRPNVPGRPSSFMLAVGLMPLPRKNGIGEQELVWENSALFDPQSIGNT